MSSHVDRRTFLGMSLAATAPLFLGRTVDLFADEAAQSDDVLVVLQLSGGNDGLSTIVPRADDAYRRARRGTLVEGALPLDDRRGLHPNLDQLLPLWKDGKMAIVEGVSYPNPNRSHFKSLDIWHTADERGRRLDTGWLGRAIDAACPTVRDPNLVINLGTTVPYALNATVHKAVSFEAIENYTWKGRAADTKTFDKLNEAPSGTSTGLSELDWLHRTAADARMSSGVVRAAAARYKARVAYPERNPTADHLRQVASLICGGLATRVFYVSMGGYDTHVRQKQAHDNLMRALGDAVAAFHKDLVAQGCSKRVLVVAFSEFGRRVAENASGGTDHGVAGPMFLFGDRVKGGLYGTHPSLTDLDDGDLKMQVDFRQVYATVLDGWLRTPSKAVLGAEFGTLPLLG